MTEATKSVSALVEQAGRDAAALAIERNKAALRRSARTAGLGAVLVVAGVSAFALANWAAVDALSAAWSGWRAPLAIAVVWLAVAVALGLLLLRRTPSPVPSVAAEERFLTTIDELADAVSRAAEQRIAAMILPVAGGMVAAGEGMIGAADEVIEAADEITDVLEERLPGGVVVNRAVDLALVPGRLGVRVARSVLRIGNDPEGS